MRLTLDERDAQLASLRREHAEASTTLESHLAGGAQLEADLHAARKQAAALAAELGSVHAALEAERRKGREIVTFADKSSGGAAQESQAQRELQQTQAQLRQMLAERDAQLTTLRQGQANSKVELDRLRAQLGHLQMRLRDNDGLAEKPQAAVRGAAQRAAQWQGKAQLRDAGLKN